MVSYFKGPRSTWKTGLPVFAKVAYRDLWPGIDLVYSGTGSRLEYSFLVRPGADVAAIRLAYRGASTVLLNRAGQLEVSTPAGGFRDAQPVAYQLIARRRVRVPAAYELEAKADETGSFGFWLSPWRL
ncbi:MAG TPA: hypothetical protein VGJ25_13545 [Gaiellaceae bacterium]|jgi:hypothetical protein